MRHGAKCAGGVRQRNSARTSLPLPVVSRSHPQGSRRRPLSFPLWTYDLRPRLLREVPQDRSPILAATNRRSAALNEVKRSLRLRLAPGNSRLRAATKARRKAQRKARPKARSRASLKAHFRAQFKARRKARFKAHRKARGKAQETACFKAWLKARGKAQSKARFKARLKARPRAHSKANSKAA